jgi:ribosome-binding factor A
MNNKRINRISEEVKKVISELIYNGLKDPRVSTMTTVTGVEVTRDLSYANVYVSVLGDKVEKEEALKGLESAKGFIRKEIGRKIELRYIPELIFHLDESIEKGMYMSKFIEEVNERDRKNRRKIDE